VDFRGRRKMILPGANMGMMSLDFGKEEGRKEKRLEKEK
jgi:hypothetical protein